MGLHYVVHAASIRLTAEVSLHCNKQLWYNNCQLHCAA